jgi:hypothetical protein
VPIDLGPATDQVFLILYGTGLRHQSNVRLPRSLAGRGEVDVVMMVDGKAANTV